MVLRSIHYREVTSDNYDGSLDVHVNLTELDPESSGVDAQAESGSTSRSRDITVRLSAAEPLQLFECIRRLRLRFAAEPLTGLDGSDHEMTIVFGLQCSVCCRWWSELPDEWSGLEEIVRILRAGAGRSTSQRT